MLIHRATAEDCISIAEVHVASWKAAYSGIVPDEFLASLSVEQRASMWRQAVAAGAPQVLVAKDNEQILGFAAFGQSRDEDAPTHRGELYAIYLAPASWSRGVGRALWRSTHEVLCATGFTSTSLWVIAGNDRAMKFYSAAGFVQEPGSAREFVLGRTPLTELRYVHSGDS